MKIWYGYGSEHSMNLVMIGRFNDAGDATKTKEIIDQIAKQVNADVDAGLMEIGQRALRYTDGMSELLRNLQMWSLGAAELEQLGYDFKIRVEGNQVMLTTDESDVSVFLKVLVENGARVEVYSAHDYPNTGHGR